MRRRPSAWLMAALLALAVPPSHPAHADGPVVHTLRRGESVWKVASLHGLTAPELADFNRIESPRALPVGLRLVLPGPQRREARIALVEALALLRLAWFEEALGAADRGLGTLDEHRADAVARALHAQLELVATAAELAFGREEAARRRLGSALRAQPDLVLEVSTTSPKLVQLLETTRQAGVAEPVP